MTVFNYTRLLIACAATIFVWATAHSLPAYLHHARAGSEPLPLQSNSHGQEQTPQDNSQETQDDEETNDARDREMATRAVGRLTDRDPLIRQGAAEGLARLSTVGERRRMIEGYRVQERTARVRLALDWALYRAGKREALFDIVRELDSPRRNQAQSYLLQLESPEPLYIFLQRITVPAKVALLQIFAEIGDAQTLEMVSPLAASIDSQISQAAQLAANRINQRLANAPASATRPRRVGGGTTPD